MKSENLSLENIINELVFSKENSYYSVKRLKKTQKNKKDLLLPAKILTEKLPDSRNAKDYYQSSLRKKNRKSVK